MARLPRLVVPKQLHHVTARGNNAQPVFRDEADYQAFLRWLQESAQQAGVAVHAYALLPNRVQLLVTPSTAEGLARMMQTLGRHYVPWFNLKYQRTGSLWEGRFRATVLDAASYFLPCAQLLEYQPVLDGLATEMEAWPWSSHAHHVGLRKDALLTDHPIYWALGNTPFDREAVYKRRCETPPDLRLGEAVDEATRKGWALGQEYFLQQIGKQTERRLQPARRGRPSKQSTA